MCYLNLYVWRKKFFFVKYLNLYKKMLEKVMRSVYKICFIVWGRGSLRFNIFKGRVGFLVFILVVLYFVKYFICCLFVE